MISSVTAAPPIIGFFSKTHTFFPDLAKYAAATRPLWPENCSFLNIISANKMKILVINSCYIKEKGLQVNR